MAFSFKLVHSLWHHDATFGRRLTAIRTTSCADSWPWTKLGSITARPSRWPFSSSGKMIAIRLGNLRRILLVDHWSTRGKKRPGLERENGAYQRDNPPFRKPTFTMAKTYELGFGLVPHQSYFQVWDPCDLPNVPNFKTWLGRQEFSPNESVIDVGDDCRAEFDKPYVSQTVKTKRKKKETT